MPSRAAIPNRAVLIGACVVVLLLLFLLVRGCGDDSLSPEQLRKQAAAICHDATVATDRVAVPNAPAGGARFLGEGLAYMRPALTDLGRLKAPEDLRDRYERAVALGVEQVALITRTEQEIRRDGDVIDSFRQLQRQLEPIVQDENELWRALDIPACVRR
ncbi:hypothetical protein [Conexibacter woesei]|uniref:Uncharacterized protein n=1 Tax=Conexibacter woesei (strain DSM 14684 / CCUG 47730 / CIP 108061 / JCM 11494 / NBRC 100937 / ID131577) TaxID=469383 RepID=D3FDG5_CONWI|nr:hypothetical protein [Conexibacter woesei]ADB49539.1 hypothetical protein Cwoe_1107 [Conexibacter woesei DSM 14684]